MNTMNTRTPDPPALVFHGARLLCRINPPFFTQPGHDLIPLALTFQPPADPPSYRSPRCRTSGPGWRITTTGHVIDVVISQPPPYVATATFRRLLHPAQPDWESAPPAGLPTGFQLDPEQTTEAVAVYRPES